MTGGVVGGVDTGAGAAFGLVRGLFLVWLMGGLAAALPLAGVATEARQSAIVQALDANLPSPTILAAQLGQLIESTGLPEVFVGAPPPADIPAGGPTQAEADQIAAAARASTLKVDAISCGNFVSGTAFAVSADHFVTNAHVVAGLNERVAVVRRHARPHTKRRSSISTLTRTSPCWRRMLTSTSRH